MYEIITADWVQLESGKKLLDIFFTCFATANNHYSVFNKLLESFLSVKVIDKASNRVVKIHYGQYGELVESFYLLFQVCTNFDTDAVDMNNKDLSREKDNYSEE